MSLIYLSVLRSSLNNPCTDQQTLSLLAMWSFYSNIRVLKHQVTTSCAAFCCFQEPHGETDVSNSGSGIAMQLVGRGFANSVVGEGGQGAINSPVQVQGYK